MSVESERRERNRFRAEMVMMLAAVAAVVTSAWQTYLTRAQFVASEAHYRADRDERDRIAQEERERADEQRREAVRPLVVPFHLSIDRPIEEAGKAEVEIINLGKGPAFNVNVAWEIDGQELLLAGPVKQSFLYEREKSTFSWVPFKEMDEAGKSKAIASNESQVQFPAKLIIRYSTANGEWIETHQKATAEYHDERTSKVVLAFEDRSVVVHKTGQDFWRHYDENIWKRNTKNTTTPQ